MNVDFLGSLVFPLETPVWTVYGIMISFRVQFNEKIPNSPSKYPIMWNLFVLVWLKVENVTVVYNVYKYIPLHNIVKKFTTDLNIQK